MTWTRDAIRRFALHYLEMVAAMLGGMVVLGVPFVLALEAGGSSWDDIAAVPQLVLMCVSMTVPMVAWMRFRGHGARPCWEMAGAMVVPTLGAIAFVAAGADPDTAMMGEHVVMPVAMLGVMLARPAEYAHSHRRAVA